MGRLLRDRYFSEDGGPVWDLATGEMLPREEVPAGREAGSPPIASLAEVLDHGQEGAPRLLGIDVSHGLAETTIRCAAAQAQAKGFVPIATGLYLRLSRLLADILRDRALVLIHTAADMEGAWVALVEASARNPRPHLLLRIRAGASRGPLLVREARAEYLRSSAAGRLVDPSTEYHLRRASRAQAFIREGRHAAAERLLRDVSGALARRSQWSPASDVLVDLGCVLLDRARVSDADRALEDAGVAAAKAGDSARLARARLWQAAARIDATRFPHAESICRAVLCGDRLSPGLRLIATATLARALLWQRRDAEASGLDLTVGADATLDAVSRAFVDSAAVRVLIAGGQHFAAGLRAHHLELIVRDADAAARAIAATALLRVLVATGDLSGARARLLDVIGLARDARAPLQALRARLIHAEGLLRAGIADGRREIQRLQRLCARGTPLLRRGVGQMIADTDDGSRARTPVRATWPAPGASAPARLVTLAHEEERDADAVRRVLDAVAAALRTSRIDVCSSDAGPDSRILSIGAGLATRLGSRVLDTGLALGPECVESGHELGVPARRGPQLVAAIVARWPADRTPPPAALDLMELAAAVVSPRLEAMLTASRTAAAAAAAVPELVGPSAPMTEVRAAILRAAAAPFAVIIQGESGVGKELAARAIHQLGPRRERRFCDVNCAALPDDLLESELFGHARGAFTGAVADRPGLFEDADGGTLFLDELGDLSLRAQAKLLRVVQQQEVRRVGEGFGRKVDVRLVAAANRDLQVEAGSGRFRQDLLYRLDVIRIRMPPLRERPEDIPALAQHFWAAAARRVGTIAVLTHGVLAALSRHHWPGNVRELQNVMAALAVAAPARGSVRAQLLPAAIAGAAPVTGTRLAEGRAQFERRAIEIALARAAGSRSRAARELGLSRQGLLKMMARLGVS